MPGSGDHASRNDAWGLEQVSSAQIDQQRADPWCDEWFANGHSRWRGNVVERQCNWQRSGNAPRPRHSARHDWCLHGFGSIWGTGAIDAATIRRGSLHRIEHLPHYRNRYRRNGTHAGIGDRACPISMAGAECPLLADIKPVRVMSALPPIADIPQCRWDVRKVTISDIGFELRR